MPPKAKFTKSEIVDAALSIVKKDGLTALTARAVGIKLNSSARPIFTLFQSMEEVQIEVMQAARELYDRYIEKALSENLPFKSVGQFYILFAINEPKLFQCLFMKEQKSTLDIGHVLPEIDKNYEKILLSIENQYALGRQLSQRLYLHLWIYTHGIAVLCATGMCSFTTEEISQMVTQVFLSLLKEMKAGEKK